MDANGDRQLLNGRHRIFYLSAITWITKSKLGHSHSKTTLAIVYQNHLGPSAALKKKLDVMVDRLTLTKDGVTKCRSVSRRNPVELEDLPGVIDIYCRGRATRLKFTSKQDLVWISGRLEGKQ